MIVIGALVWLLVIAFYGAIWIGVVLLLWSVQRRRGLSLLESDGTVAPFVLRMFAVAMALFPVFALGLYVPHTLLLGEHAVLEKPRLIQSMGIACAAATALAVFASVVCCSLVEFLQSRSRQDSRTTPAAS
jgi:hypothetical protein